MPIDLNRFIQAQEQQYAAAYSEIKAGRKTGHWMWFIFPQIIGLGYSSTSAFYAIKSLDEAKAYLDHDILGLRLRNICTALLAHNTDNARHILGSPDDLKLHASVTLFAIIDKENKDNVFEKVLTKFFNGREHYETVQIVEELKYR